MSRKKLPTKQECDDALRAAMHGYNQAALRILEGLLRDSNDDDPTVRIEVAKTFNITWVALVDRSLLLRGNPPEDNANGTVSTPPPLPPQPHPADGGYHPRGDGA